MELSLQSSGYVVQKMPRGVLLNSPVEDKRTACGTSCGMACFCKLVYKVSNSVKFLWQYSIGEVI